MKDTGIANIFIIIFGSILFYTIHFKKKQKITLLVELELLLFSVLLYSVYLKTNSLFDIWIIHFIRNAYLDFYKTNILNEKKY